MCCCPDLSRRSCVRCPSAHPAPWHYTLAEVASNRWPFLIRIMAAWRQEHKLQLTKQIWKQVWRVYINESTKTHNYSSWSFSLQPAHSSWRSSDYAHARTQTHTQKPEVMVTHRGGAALRPGASCSALLRDWWRFDQIPSLLGEHLQGAFAVHPHRLQLHVQPPHPPPNSPLVRFGARRELCALEADSQPRWRSVCLPPPAVAHRAAQAHRRRDRQLTANCLAASAPRALGEESLPRGGGIFVVVCFTTL